MVETTGEITIQPLVEFPQPATFLDRLRTEMNTEKTWERLLADAAARDAQNQHAHANDKDTNRNLEEYLTDITATLRGLLAEKASEMLPITDHPLSVFGSLHIPNEAQLLTFEQFTGQDKKNRILEWAVQKSLREAPPTQVDILKTHKRQPQAPYGTPHNPLWEIVTAYTTKNDQDKTPDGEVTQRYDQGLFYKHSSLPDGLIMENSATEADILGFVEVKAYTPDEFAILVRELESAETPRTYVKVEQQSSTGRTVTHHFGAHIAREVQCIDDIRAAALGKGRSPHDAAMHVLLRFPNDIPQEDFSRYATIVKTLFPNTHIQTLPVSSGDLTNLARELLYEKAKTVRRHMQNAPFVDNQDKDTLAIRAALKPLISQPIP